MANITEIQELLNKLRSDIKEDMKAEIQVATEKLDIKLDTKLSELEEKNKITNTKIEKLEERIKILEEKNKSYERNTRKQNVIIYGLLSKPSSFQEQLTTVLSFFNTHLEIPTKKEEINFISRIGPKNTTINAIVVGLTSTIKKLEILRSGNKLKGSKISISEDFPKEVVIKRKELLPKLKQLRKENRHAILSYDKLLVDGNIYEENPINEKKRDLKSMETDAAENSQNQDLVHPRIKRLNSVSKPRGRPPSKSRAESKSQPNSRSSSPQIIPQTISQQNCQSNKNGIIPTQDIQETPPSQA